MMISSHPPEAIQQPILPNERILRPKYTFSLQKPKV